MARTVRDGRVAKLANPPTEWSETKNIKWKMEIPGRGSSSPVVWGDRIYLQTAVPVGLAGDASHKPRGGINPRGAARVQGAGHRSHDGQGGVGKTAREQAPHEASHFENGTWSSGSAITDGQHVIAYFESFGLYCYDMNGTLVWEKDLGDKKMRNEFGEGSTPVLHGNTLVVVWDHLVPGQSFVVALDKRSGKELWRVEPRRDRYVGDAARGRGRRAARRSIVPGDEQAAQLRSARPARSCGKPPALTMNPIPSPVVDDDMVFRDQRLPREQPEGDPARRREG